MVTIAKSAGGNTLADPDGIATGQSIAAGASWTINGSLTSGGSFSNPGWGHKVVFVSGGNDSGKTFYATGKFCAANAIDYTTTISVTGANAGTATSSLYAVEITGAYTNTATASTVTIGLSTVTTACPTTLRDGPLYQIVCGGTYDGATHQLQRYHALTNEWINIGTATTAALIENLQIPVGTTVRPSFTSASAGTTSVGISAEQIQQR